MSGTDALLVAAGITKRFDGILALDEVPLEVRPGECVGLIGPNGAGKSTLFDCLTGRLAPDAGRVSFQGQPLDGRSGAARARMGLARTFQRIELFPGMTATDHLLVAMQAHCGQARLWRDLVGRGRPSLDDRKQAADIAEMLGLTADADRPVESLTMGQARLVELGRALACDPVLLFLDEPSSGLDRDEAQAMARVLEEVRTRAGTAILLIEHDVPLVRRLASRLYVLDAGRLVAEGPTEDVLAHPDVRTAYLGAGT
ncbi:MAG TPA: ABC transporter ATP-binding protein [Acidimicrobiales bacterium]|jgi:branched-chain amino acid transport system ATP-binding protein